MYIVIIKYLGRETGGDVAALVFQHGEDWSEHATRTLKKGTYHVIHAGPINHFTDMDENWVQGAGACI